jgi:hypothetical protein
MKPLHGALLALFLCTGCDEKVAVTVNCVTTAAPAVECEVTQTAGKREAEACWDFMVECGNGGIVTAPRTCQKVKDGGSTMVTIPADKLTGMEGCGGSDPKATVSNFTINGKTPDKAPE